VVCDALGLGELFHFLDIGFVAGAGDDELVFDTHFIEEC